MRKAIVVVMILVCAMTASAQVGGKWKRITNYSNETGDKLMGVSVDSLSTVPADGIERTATLIITANKGKPMLAMDFGGVWVIDVRESESWFDEAKDKPVKVVWVPKEKKCGDNPCTTLISLSDELVKGMAKAQLFRIKFWASNGKQYVHTFPVSSLSAHAKFLGLKLI